MRVAIVSDEIRSGGPGGGGGGWGGMDTGDRGPWGDPTPIGPTGAYGSAPVPVAPLQLEGPAFAPKRRPLLRVLLALMVVAVVAGAGALVAGGSKMKSPTVVLSEAEGRTTAAGTASVSSDETLTVGGETRKILHAEGTSDFANKASTFTLTVGGLREHGIFVGGVSYLRVPAVGVLPHGAHWIAITRADAKVDASAGSSVGSTDPSTGLRFLGAISGSPTAVGHETVDGVATTHYAFTLDLKAFYARMAKSADALNAPRLGSSLEQLGSLVDLSALPGEAWLDTDGRVRRFELTISVTEQGETAKVVVGFHFSHFDEPVDVTAPAASDTIAFREDRDFFKQVGAAAARLAAGSN